MEQISLPQAINEVAYLNGRSGYPANAGAPGFDYGYASDDDSGELLEYWRIIKRHKLVVLLVSAIGVILALLFTTSQTPIYQAHTLLEVQELNENFLNIKQVNPLSQGDGSTGLSDIPTQIRLLQSDSLIKRVMAKLQEQKQAIPQGSSSRIAAWRKALGLRKQVATKGDSAEMAKNLKVRPVGQTRVVEVLYDSIDPKFAAAFVNTLATEFIESNLEARLEMSASTNNWLSRQLDEMRIKLEKSEDALQTYARDAGLMFTSEKTNVSEDKLKQLQAELSKAQADRVTAQSKWETTKTSLPDALPEVLSDSSLRSIQDKLTDLHRQRAELLTTYTEQHTKVRRVESQIAPLEASLEKERVAIVDRMKNDYDAATRREKLLTADYATQFQLVSGQSERSIHYNILKREVDSNRQLYEAMLQQVKESSIASAMRSSNIRIVDPADAPKSPYDPSLPFNGALGLLSGLFLGVTFIIVRDRADRTLKQPNETQFWLNLPLLQVIPSGTKDLRKLGKRPEGDGSIGVLSLQTLQQQNGQLTTDKNSTHSSPAHDRNINSASNGSGAVQVELLANLQKHSMLANSFRSLLTSILFCGNNGDGPRVLVLTSASPMEGKTTVASNLALAMAELKHRVLLIDGDMRKPRIHEIFKVPNYFGLNDLLLDGHLPNAPLESVVQRLETDGLYILPSGAADPRVATLLHSKNLPLLIAKAKLEFDMVIIDTPPMLQMPDARIFGRLADGVILVARAGKTTRDAAVAAKRRFTDDRTKLLGIVLNDWDSTTDSYYLRDYEHYT